MDVRFCEQQELSPTGTHCELGNFAIMRLARSPRRARRIVFSLDIDLSWISGTPILVVNCGTVCNGDRAHWCSPECWSGKADRLAVVGSIASNTGVLLSLTRTTINLAGCVSLAFRPTVWMSFGPS
jgi:hypothetical protein